LARILYISVHEILEYDDITLLQRLGHSVFSLGVFFPGRQGGPFRSALDLDPRAECLLDPFLRSTPRDESGKGQIGLVAPDFVRCFDLVIVTHDIAFIENNWTALSQRPVIWRTVGQAIEALELRAAPLRGLGLHIVRWSPKEQQAPSYCGHDAIIRGYKDPLVYRGWDGEQSRQILTFSNIFASRYPAEYAFFQAAVQGYDAALGGAHNDSSPQAIGLVDSSEQTRLLQSARTYFYCHGTQVPYTLNFIEAWMTGAPVVALSRSAALSLEDTKYYEIADLVDHGANGYVVDSVDAARQVFDQLLQSSETCRRVGNAGRHKAIKLFGFNEAAVRWQSLIGALVVGSTAASEAPP
jgi:hypothetical protein